ncbi:hypothetical protein [Halarsenatibacter silvermanii]|uniref:Uncharacterized protein n=1 Tax=Halarsenatibacter silvermanii TaxID=321763 RepID=A0A1G9RDF2_9FIRM|nr:hypothetical protein [Halarsenatibacter silvermanii]SDM21201.1 hypothetical protein SAMN04488692_12145 [Halarsenatibacter silvermanii]
MAVTARKYTRANYNAYRGNLSDPVDGATVIKVALMEESFVFNQNIDDNWDDISEHEISAAENPPYEEGGQELANKSFDVEGNAVVLDGDNIIWPNSNITAHYAVIYDATPAEDTDKKLLGIQDFDGEKSTSDGNFEIQWHENGILAVEALS